jgi:hypothetical protein
VLAFPDLEIQVFEDVQHVAADVVGLVHAGEPDERWHASIYRAGG